MTNTEIIDEHLLNLRRYRTFINNYNNITLTDKLRLLRHIDIQITFICNTLYVPQTDKRKCKFSIRDMYKRNYKYIARG